MFLLRCPKCKNQMKYEGRKLILSVARKECVYCGATFKVKDNIIQEIRG